MTDKAVQISEERLELLEAVLDREQTVSQGLREQLHWNAMLAGEDMGWTKVFGGGLDNHRGPTLEELKEQSEKLRDGLGNVHIQRGLRLRTNNVWGNGGIHYDYESLPDGSGFKKQTKKKIADPLNQLNFFGSQAHSERESALYTDGLYLVLGDPSDWSLEPWSLANVGSVQVNPRRTDEIIAYRLDFTDYTNKKEGEHVKEWHYTDLGFKRKDKSGFGIILENDEKAPDTRVIFDMHVNTQVGWLFGIPDSLAAFAWAKVYRDFIMNGKVMSDAMAQFAFQIATGSKKETENVAARIAQPSDAGGTLVGGNSLVPLPTAGKGYDFESGRALLAIVAAALEVSTIAISADSGNSGGGYASESSLDLPTMLAMVARQQRHIDFDRRVLVWMGADPELDIFFDSLENAADEYREIQALKLALDSGLFQPEPIEARLSQLLRIVGNKVPDGYLQPNNLKTSKAQAALKPKPEPAGNDAPAKPGKKSTAAPDQGKSSGAGKSDVKGNDIRNDKVSK